MAERSVDLKMAKETTKRNKENKQKAEKEKTT